MNEKIVRYCIAVGVLAIMLGATVATASASQFMTLPMADKDIQIWKYVSTSEHTLTYPGHEGTDYNTGQDMYIRAVADGTAYLREQSENGIIEEGGFGYYVDIDHGNGYWTRYAHLRKDGRKSGTVKRGDVIGNSSNSGAPWSGCWEPHLHLEVRQGG